MDIDVSEWKLSHEEAMTLDAIRNLYPEKGYRISQLRCVPGEQFRGVQRSGEWFVLVGSCTVSFDHEVKLRRGQVAVMPEGKYTLRVVGGEPLHIVMAWKLPPPFDKLDTVFPRRCLRTEGAGAD